MVPVTWPRWPPCPCMVKTLKKSSSLEPVDRFQWNLVCSNGGLWPIIVCIHHDLGLTLTYFMARSSLVKHMVHNGKSENIGFLQDVLWPLTWNFVHTYHLLIQWSPMDIQGQGHLLALAKCHVHIKFKTLIFSETTSPIKAKFYMWYP